MDDAKSGPRRHIEDIPPREGSPLSVGVVRIFPALLQGWEVAQSALRPAGIQAERISDLWWIFLTILGLIWLSVMTMLVVGLVRGRRRAEPATDEATTRRQTRAVASAVGISILILFGLTAADFTTNRAIASLAAAHPDPLVVRVTGHQWWWEVRYEDSIPALSFTTANEIVVPVGRPVLVRLEAADVIHSFWVPNLHGKRDLIPGYSNAIWIQADEPGLYRGQCAEYCGDQHAKMALLVIAQPPDSFAAWYEAQLRPAPEPVDSSSAHGRRVFNGGPCAACHTIRGTRAGGRVGPDLTHLASRRTLAAGTVPNTRDHLAGWVVNSQSIKPGNRMPPMPLPGPDLQALLDYLETLE